MITVEKFTLFTIVFEFSLGLASCWLRMTETKIFVVIVRTLWGRMQVRTGGKGRQRETVDMLIYWAEHSSDWIECPALSPSLSSLDIVTAQFQLNDVYFYIIHIFLFIQSYFGPGYGIFFKNKEYIEYILYVLYARYI